MNLTALPERIQRKIAVADNGCWHWTGSVNSRGYGQTSINGVSRSAHRVTWQLLVGPIGDGLQIDHQCHNQSTDCPGGVTCLHRRCCNPAHLEPVEPVINSRRSPYNHKTHCLRGHAMTDENTIVRTRRQDGYVIRNCRTCANSARREKDREWVAPEPLTAGARQHGTTTGYNYYKCRCADCRRAFADYMADWRSRRRAAS